MTERNLTEKNIAEFSAYLRSEEKSANVLYVIMRKSLI